MSTTVWGKNTKLKEEKKAKGGKRVATLRRRISLSHQRSENQRLLEFFCGCDDDGDVMVMVIRPASQICTQVALGHCVEYMNRMGNN